MHISRRYPRQADHSPNVHYREAATIPTESVEYTVAGKRYIGQLALPGGTGRAPGVLVCHEGSGLDDNAISRAERLAELGYVAFALDYHGDGKALPMAEIMPLIESLLADPESTRAIGRAGLEVLRAHERVDADRLAAIGYCFGGTMALELGRAGEGLCAIVGFHSGLGTARPEDNRNVTAKVLVCIGADDPLVPADQRAEFEQQMTDAGVDWQLHLYGGAAHSFTNPNAAALNMPGVAYEANADERSWEAMLDLFGGTLSAARS